MASSQNRQRQCDRIKLNRGEGKMEKKKLLTRANTLFSGSSHGGAGTVVYIECNGTTEDDFFLWGGKIETLNSRFF